MKKILKNTVCTAVCAATIFCAVNASAKTVQFTMNNSSAKVLQNEITNVELLCAPYTKSDRTLIPVRFVSENFGAKVDWDEDTKTVTISKDGKTVTLQINSTTAYDGEMPVTLDTAPEQTNDVTMVPVRFVAETLGYTVNYSQMGEKVLVTDEKPLFEINGKNIMPSELKAYSNIAIAQYNATPNKEFADYIYNSFKGYCVLANSMDENILAQNIKTINENAEFIKGQIQSVTEQVGADTLDGSVELVFENLNYGSAYQNYLLNKIYDGISDSEIDEAYKNDYICAKHILITKTDENAAKKINEVSKKIKNKADFDKLIEEYGEDPGMKSNPDGYIFTKGEMVQEFEDAAFALKEGKISGAVESSYGTHFIKREKLPALTDSVKENVKQNLTSGKTNIEINKIIDGAADDNYTAEEIENLIMNK